MLKSRYFFLGIDIVTPHPGQTGSLSGNLVKLLALVVIAYSSYLAIRYASQPLVFGEYGFRQTQTALTSFWFMQDGFKLAYETPVAGAPWAMPFEFPLYQAIVALIAQVAGTSLDATGRVVSYLFLLACLFPVRSICQNLRLPSLTVYVFAGLLLSSPLYVFWSRSFMIETAALFFSVLAISAFVAFTVGRSPRQLILFVVFVTLSILQKATTGLPVLAVLAVVALFTESAHAGGLFRAARPANLIRWFLVFAIPIGVGYAWTTYTDVLKVHNELGSYLTSTRLVGWTWGTLAQRMSRQLYEGVIWSRVVAPNLAGVFGLALVAYGLIHGPRTRWVVLTACALGLLPLFLFTNVHLIHAYYQSANVFFLIFALAVSLATLGANPSSRGLAVVLFAALIVHNHLAYRQDYRRLLTMPITLATSHELLVADTVKNNTPANSAFIAYGNDWSSSLAYYAQRKSFTVPNWFKNREAVIANPQAFLGDAPLGAVVLCPKFADRPTVSELLGSSPDGKPWKATEIAGCYVTIPEKEALVPPASPSEATCEGSIDLVTAPIAQADGAIDVKGWTVVSGAPEGVGGAVYLVLTDANGAARYYDTVRYARPDVNAALGNPALGAIGFGRLIDTKGLAGDYTVGVVRMNGGQAQACQFRTSVHLQGAH